MYTWIWERLPGSTPVRAALAGLIALAAIALLVLVVFPLVRPGDGSFVDGNDPAGADPEQVVEPDGVRRTPVATTPPAGPTPVIPEDTSVPQQ
ncbi:MAG: hypothetical protein R2737_16465 [Candidatus Nanopelagicales bacterium]